jgi:hypothetical protein
MYLNASTDSIEIILGGTVTANQLQWNVSFQDITSTGMTLPQSAGAGLTNNATLVTMVAAPAASTTRQVTQINVYNADTATATVTIRKDVSGTKYVLMRIALTTLDVLMWSRENGWRLMSATGGGTSYTFSTGLTNTIGTVTSNLSTGVAGGQSVVGGTAASNSLTLSSTSNATKGKILFGTSAYDEVNNRLGIGTNAPDGPFHVSTSSSVNANLISSARLLQLTNNVASIGSIVTSSDSGGAGAYSIWTGVRSRGTLTSPTTPLADDYIFGLVSNAYDGTASGGGTAGLFFISDANVTAGNAPQRIAFSTSLTNNLGRTEKLQIKPNGNVIIQNGGTFTDAGFRLDVNGTARFQGNVTLSTKDIVTDTTTGSKIATGNTQKLGFWNATPIAQPTTAVAAATLVGGGGTTLTDTDTFDGYTLKQVVKALRNAGLLA